MKKVLIVDMESPYPYDFDSLNQRAMGGTEATVLRVAKAIGKDFQIYIAQRAREQISKHPEAVFFPLTWKKINSLPLADVVIVIRNHKLLPKLRKLLPSSVFYLWMHCLPGKKHKKNFAKNCYFNRTKILCVSHTQKMELKNFSASSSFGEKVEYDVIYNPLSEDVLACERNLNINKLFFASSPHKGWSEVVDHFIHLRKHFPQLKLFVANPGYIEWKDCETEGVVFLGCLSHREVLKHLSECLCLFYPQSSFKETFGLVFAEANAVGAPALTHDIGSAKEILSFESEQLIDATSKEEVFRRIKKWRENGPPKVRMNQEFNIDVIAEKWKKVLNHKEHGSDRRNYRTRVSA